MKHILFVGDPKMIARGPLGASVPTACLHSDGTIFAPAGPHADGDGAQVGLVLAWNGEPVHEGCYRLAMQMICAENHEHGRGPYPQPNGGLRWYDGQHQEGVHIAIEAGENNSLYLQINSRSSFNHPTMGDLAQLSDAPEGPLRTTWMLATAAADYLGGKVVVIVEGATDPSDG